MKNRRATERIDYHHGFYAAMKVEYDLMQAPVSYEQEKELGEKPVRLDFLIIKKAKHAVLTDPIGQFFQSVNLFEYKSPEDGLTIDDFYKAQGYGLIYKGFDRKVNELPIEDMTLTFVRHAYPRELVKELKATGFQVKEAKSMNPVIRALFHDEFEALEKKAAAELEATRQKSAAELEAATQRSAADVKEQVATDMLKGNYTLKAIEEISHLPEDTIRAIAQKIGVPVVS